jgi:DNA-binding cell septation regulator SpoVG
MADHEVRVRSWVRASDDDVTSGLLGWITIAYGSLLVDNITLRRTSDGRLALSFPSRTAKNGQKHSIVRPVDNEARIAIERAILGQLGQREELVP